MVRTVDEAAHESKRNEILDAAFRLFVQSGYEGMSIDALLGALDISKGSFYHYFNSKRALLEALLERMLAEMERQVEPISKDTDSTASSSIKKFFDAIASHKASRKPFVARVLQGWYGDENSIVREKIRAECGTRLAPFLAMIIRRGCERGEFAVSDPDHAARIVLALTQDLSDTLARSIVFDQRPKTSAWPAQAIDSTTEAIERILCASPGSISIAEKDAISLWFPDTGRSKREI